MDHYAPGSHKSHLKEVKVKEHNELVSVSDCEENHQTQQKLNINQGRRLQKHLEGFLMALQLSLVDHRDTNRIVFIYKRNPHKIAPDSRPLMAEINKINFSVMLVDPL